MKYIRVVLVSGFMLIAGTLQTQPAQQILNDVSYEVLSGDRADIRFEFEGELVAEPVYFSTDNPSRIAIDFKNTSLAPGYRKERDMGVGAISKITTVEVGGRARVIVNLTRSIPYAVKSSGKFVILSVGISPEDVQARKQQAASDVGESSDAFTAESAEKGSTSSFALPSVRDIDFHRGEGGEGRVLVELSDPSVQVDVREEGKKILIDFRGVTLPESLGRRLEVTDFATPVKTVDTVATNYGARMTIDTIPAPNDHIVYQADHFLTIEVKELTKTEEEDLKRKRVGYTGERLSLNFQNISVRAVLQLIADFTEFNLVVSDTVSGSVTLRLKNVPWDQALDIVLKTKGLAKRRDGNVMLVAPHEEIVAREQLELESAKQHTELEPLQTEFVTVDYAKASELAALITSGAGKDKTSLLTERGSVTIDDRTNTLIVQDVPTRLEAVRRLVQRLDIPVRQVLIESRIVFVEDTFAKDIGIRWGLSDNNLRVGRGANANNLTVGGGIPGNIKYDAGRTAFDTGGQENFIVGLPASAPTTALSLAFGRVGSRLLQLQLSARLSEGRAENISSPTVITTNQKEATIESGVEIPYQESSSSGATTVSFKKAVISLKVTPQITPDDRVLLDLRVNQDAIGSQVVNGVPTINTRTVETRVLVDNGQTVVLGGIYTTNKVRNTSRVPFFSDIPFLGAAFRQKLKTDTNRELMIFVTPKVDKALARGS